MQTRPLRLPFLSGPLPSAAALLAVRVVIGGLLALHGYRKLDAGVGKFVGSVARYGFPFPGFLARATIVIELVGGLCLMLGLLTRGWAALVTLEMLWIIAKVSWSVGPIGQGGRPGFELNLLYAVSATALLIAGPGLLAVDHLLGLEADPADEAPARRGDGVRAGA
jgi:putative oxidoreductase